MSSAPKLVTPAAFARGIPKITGSNPLLQIPGVCPVGTSSLSLTVNQIHYMPFEVRTNTVIDQLAHEVTVAPATAALRRLGIVAANGFMQPTGPVLLDTELAVPVVTTGVATTGALSVSLVPGRYLLLSNISGNNFTVRTVLGATPNAGLGLASLSANTMATLWTFNQAYGAFTAPVPEWVTAAMQSVMGFRYSVFPRLVSQ